MSAKTTRCWGRAVGPTRARHPVPWPATKRAAYTAGSTVRPPCALLKRLDGAWGAFKESYAGLSDAQLMEPGVSGAWSVRDILAHVTAWEEEALKHLPLILEGGQPPRYSLRYGGIDAFNAQMTEQKRGLE